MALPKSLGSLIPSLTLLRGKGEWGAGEGLLPPHLGREVDQLRERLLIPLVALQEIQQAPCGQGEVPGLTAQLEPVPTLGLAGVL